MTAESLARQAYQAYCEQVDFLDANKPMPRWEEMPANIRLAWQVSAIRVVNLIFHRAQHMLLGVADL
jgi:hypothetical protein